MNIYIACPYEMRERAKHVANVLAIDKHTITARWLLDSHDGDDKGDATDWPRHAVEDLRDVQAAECVVVLNPEGFETKGTGGRHTELGIALALGHRVLLVGQRSQVFHHTPSVIQIDEGGDFRKAVARIASHISRVV